MTSDVADLLISTPPETLFLLIAMNMLRILGFLFGFVPLYFGLMQSVILRANIAVALSLPVVVFNIETVSVLASTKGLLDLALLAPKEFLIGGALGILASAPFAGVIYAGAITDNFRGESDSGIQSPTGGQIPTTSLLYLIITVATLFHLDIFKELMGLLYESFRVWPIDSLTPDLPLLTEMRVGDFLSTSLSIGVKIAAPLLIVLMLAELAIIVAARLARKMGLYDLAFPVKNLLTILLLPITTLLVLRSAEPLMITATEALWKLLDLFR